jgi:hypothetical protein
VTNLIKSQRLMFEFLIRDGWALFRAVASAYDSPRKIQTAQGTVATQLVFSRELVDGYNRRYEDLKNQLHRLVPTRGLFGSSFIVPLFLIRIACVISAATTSFAVTFAISLLQFVVAPYSFFAAFAAWLGVVPFYIIHFITFAVLQFGTSLVFAQYPVLGDYLLLPITPVLIAAWIVVDQLSCLVLFFWTPVGPPARVPLGRALQSVGYGFINCKTYWLVLLLSLRGMPIDLLALGIHALIPFHLIMRSAKLLTSVLPPGTRHWTFPSAMFYHYHRMVHLPGAYVQAHRHHHYLLDSTAFDADMHGSGMPEEWFKLMTEISVCLLTSLMPWSFTRQTLMQSLKNRLGHTRIEGEHPMLDNFHVNHHTRHVKNFGFASLPLDLLLGTEYGDVSRMDNLDNGKTRVTRVETEDHYVLDMRSTDTEPAGASSNLISKEGASTSTIEK